MIYVLQIVFFIAYRITYHCCHLLKKKKKRTPLACLCKIVFEICFPGPHKEI